MRNAAIQSMGSVRAALAQRVNSIFPTILIATCGGMYLYAFNTLPVIFDPYFQGLDTTRLWIMQISIFLSYSLLALTMLFSARLLDRLLVQRPHISLPFRILLGTLSVFVSTFIVLVSVILPEFRKAFDMEWGAPWMMCFISGISGSVAYASALIHRSSKARREKGLQIQMDTDGLRVALDRAELSMLEAQIEPHFLFNTLAHVKRQYRIDVGKANRMLTSLIAYLGRAMPALRRDDWTIGDELDLVKVYLEIMGERFGSRLQFSIQASDICKPVCLPALIIATLVENAVRHGIAPKAAGGMIAVTIRMNAKSLQIEVSDDGVGFRKGSGNGMGLATTQARLRGAFGRETELLVAPRHPEGVLASIQIPLRQKM
jgi:sensor histidine kinase YesM